MKKHLLKAVMLCIFATTGSAVAAYSAEQDNDQPAVKQPHIAGFISNPFKDNWEIQAGVGPTFNFHTLSGAKHTVSVGGHIGAVKWIHPVFGFRFDVEAGQFAQIETTPQYVTGEKNDNWTYVYLHPDFMVNLSNWIGGYKDYRVYNAIFYIGGGFAAGGMNFDKNMLTYNNEGEPTTYGFLGNIGLQNRFYVCKALSIDLQLQFEMGKGEFRPVGGKIGHFFGASAMVGVTYRFNNRDFIRCGATADEVDAMQNTLKNLQDKADKTAKERDDLQQALNDKEVEAQQAQDELAALKDEAAKRAARNRQAGSAKEAIDRDVYDEILFYEIGTANLTEYHKQRLDLIAERVKADDEKQVYKVEGFADAQTGTAKCNARLAEKRARVAYDYLLSKGVPEERLEFINGGTANCPFGKPVHNRVVVIY